MLAAFLTPRRPTGLANPGDHPMNGAESLPQTLAEGDLGVGFANPGASERTLRAGAPPAPSSFPTA